MTEETIFAAALEKADPSDRAAFLAEVCGTDSAMRKRVESLLAANSAAGDFLNKPPIETPDPEAAATRAFHGNAATDPDGHTRTHGDGPHIDSDDALTFLSPARRPDSLGRIGHYEVLEVLGRGGFGIVYRAFDDVLQRVVAVKVLAPQMAATSPARKRFLREARSSAKVKHENIVQIHATEEQPLPYLVMEFIPGETLQQRLDRTGPLEYLEVIRIGRQIAEGLAAAHAEGLVHRDIKPANVLIDGGPNGRVKLTDFGLARAADDASISQSGVVAGTPMYMAPEQAKGEMLDHRADLFSLGSVLYVMCSGRPPFRASGTFAVLKRVIEEDPRPIREIIPEVPEWFCRIIEKLHAKKPDDRFQTAREVADVLADCEHQLKQHGALRDYSRIPGGAPKGRRLPIPNWKWVAALVLLPLITLGIVIASNRGWENTYRYAANQSALLIDVGDPHVEEVIILKDGVPVERVGSGLAIRPLPPGEYQVRVVTSPGYSPSTMHYESDGFRGPNGTWTTNPPEGRYTVVLGRGSQMKIRPTAIASPPGSDGFTPLFDGVNLTGWKWHPQSEGRGYSNTLGVMTLNGPTHMFTERVYTDFHLRIEARCAENAEPMLGVRAPFDVDSSGRVRCLATGLGLGANTVYNPWDGVASGPVENLKPGDWYTQEWIVKGDFLQVKVNGQQILHTGNLLAPSGHVVLTIPPQKLTVRKIEIKDLSPPTDDFTPLFNGTDLTGWKPVANWTVTDGILHSIQNAAVEPVLLTQRDDFANFRLRAEVRVNELANGALWLRQTAVVPAGVYPVPLNLKALNPGRAQQGKPLLAKPGEWFILEVITDDNFVTVMVNGTITSYWTDPNRQSIKGALGLVHLLPQSLIEFRKIEIKELPPSSTPPSNSFTPLFNGTDLTGWEGDRDIWQWKDGALVGTLMPQHGLRNDFLWSPRKYKDFEMKFKVRLKGGNANSGVQFRSQVLDADRKPAVLTGPQLDIGGTWWGSLYNEQPATGGGLYWQANVAEVEKVLKPDDFNDISLRAVGNRITITINGLTTIDRSIGEFPLSAGVIGFQLRQYGKTPIEVTFKDVVIRELLPRSPTVPASAAEVLPYLAGNWKIEKLNFDQKVVPDKNPFIGNFSYAYIAGGKFLLGRSSALQDNLLGTIDLLDVWSFEADINTMRRWVARSDGFISGSITGQFAPASRTLSTNLRIDDKDSTHQYEFIDSNTFNHHFTLRDASGKPLSEQHHRWIRVQEPVALSSLPPDPKRPPEMKVLDRLVGEWRDEAIITKPTVPDKSWKHTARVRASLILGDRFIESVVTNDDNSSYYMLTWFDPASKQYRQWSFSEFNERGYSYEMAGAWNEATKTLDWKFQDKDGSTEEQWAFKSDDLREFKHVVKRPDGTVMQEATVISRRVRPDAPTSDEDRLQGTWRAFEAESRGEKMPADAAGISISFIGDKVRLGTPMEPSADGTFKLGANKNPKEIDVIANADFRGMRGIYKIEGDVLTICMGEPGPNRPTKFETGPDTGKLVVVKFRKGPANEGFTSLFNNKDLTGWKKHPDKPGDWKVENGILLGRPGKAGYLFTERGDFENFHLRAEVKLNAGGDSGLFFRTQLGPFVEGKKPQFIGKKSPPGYEAQLFFEAPSRTGSLMLVQEGKEPGLFREGRQLVSPDQWFTLEVIAEGPWLRVKVNGEQTVYLKNDTYSRGHIALQMWNDNTDVQFRKIEIKELPPAAPGPEVIKPLQDVLAAQYLNLGTVKAQYQAGKLSVLDVTVAEIAVAEARIKLRQAEENKAEVYFTHVELLGLRQRQRDLISLQVNAELVAPNEEHIAIARLADTRARVAEARTAAPNADPAGLYQRMIGNWKVDGTVTSIGKVERVEGRATFEPVAGGRFLRGAVALSMVRGESQSVLGFDPATGKYRRWSFPSGPIDPLATTWNEAERSLTWTEVVGTTEVVRVVTFLSDRTFTYQITDKSSGKTNRVRSYTYTRDDGQPVVSQMPLPKERLDELKLPDSLIGEWETSITTTSTDQKKLTSSGVRHSVRAILGGKFVESEEDHRPAGDEDHYWVFGFDPIKKCYRYWGFLSNGAHFVVDCQFDPQTRTLSSTTADGKPNGTWVFESADERRMKWVYFTADGKAATAGEGKTVRVSPPKK